MNEIINFQKKKIKEKNMLNFDQELNFSSKNKREYSKTLRNELDIFITTLQSKGVTFYGVTINFLELQSMNTIHTKIEELVNLISSNIELVEFLYFSIEKHKKEKLNGLPHVHGVIGVRSLIGNNVILSLKRFFYNFRYDTQLDYLCDVKNIKKWWNYVLKENNFKFHTFVYYSKWYENLYAILANHEHQYDPSGTFKLYYHNSAKYTNIKGLDMKNPKFINILLYLFNLWFQKKGFFFFKDDFFSKIPGSRYAWEIQGNLSYLKENKITIIKELIAEFPQQLGELFYEDLLLKEFDTLYQILQNNNEYLPCLKFDTSVVEFSDGLYFLNYNYFLDFYKNKDLMNKLKINCYKYFKHTFNYCKLNLPKFWLKLINNNVKDLEYFCANLGRYFHNSLILDEKKKTLCIIGGSNTGKTTLIAKIITQIIGNHNVGIIDSTETFAFEQIEHKQVIICDEFRFVPKNREDILKVLNNEPVLLNKKNKSKIFYTNKAPVIFLFNENRNNKMLNDSAFVNRLLIYNFDSVVNIPMAEINENLKKELPQIMIYCNDLFFRKKLNQGVFLTSEFKFKKKNIKEYIQKYLE